MKCPDCEDGWVEREIYHKQSFNLDTGYIEVIRSRECETCGGTGEIENDDDILQEIDDRNYAYAKKLHDAIFNQVGQEAMKLRASNAVRDAINKNGMEKVKLYRMRDFSGIKYLGRKAVKLIMNAQSKVEDDDDNT
jgi:hypothetical protein